MTDPAVLAGIVDAVVLVVSMGSTTRSGVVGALENLARVNAPVVGVILNKVSSEDAYTYYQYSNGKPVHAMSKDKS